MRTLVVMECGNECFITLHAATSNFNLFPHVTIRSRCQNTRVSNHTTEEILLKHIRFQMFQSIGYLSSTYHTFVTFAHRSEISPTPQPIGHYISLASWGLIWVYEFYCQLSLVKFYALLVRVGPQLTATPPLLTKSERTTYLLVFAWNVSSHV